MRDLHLD